jgi:hypothetical protein
LRGQAVISAVAPVDSFLAGITEKAGAAYKFAGSGAATFIGLFPPRKTGLLAGSKELLMTLEESVGLVKKCATEMDARYGKTVFDEWAIVSLAENRARVLAYIGPRNDDFLANFAKDLGALRSGLLHANYGVGDFEFARHGIGTGFESFMVLGRALYLICNNTRESMETIAQNPRWLAAQVPFAELSEQVRASPLAVAGGDTKFFRES